MKDYKWVACSKEMSWAAAQHRHVIAKGGLTTLCGHSASHPEVWRGNSTKESCETCAAELAKLTPPPAAKKEKDMPELTKSQKEYLLMVKEQSSRLRTAAENMQRSLAEDTLAALEPGAEVWPGIPSADEIFKLQKAHAKLDLLISMRRVLFPFDTVTAAEINEQRRLFTAALAGTWKP